MGKNNSRQKNDNKIVKVILIVFLVLEMLISVFPFLYMLTISLMETMSLKISIDRLMTANWTLGNYTRLITEGHFLTYFKNSALITIYAVVINCTFSTMAAYAFAKKKFFGSNVLFLLFMATMMVPYQVTLIPCFIVLKSLGMLNTYSAVALPMCGAFGVLLVHQFVKGLPNDLLEAADLDGCGEIRKFTSIVVPLLKPVIVSLAIFTFIDVWGAFVLPLIVNTENDKMVLNVAIASMKSTKYGTDYGFMMAASTVAFLPPFILYLFLQKQFVEGIALSGTKM